MEPLASLLRPSVEANSWAQPPPPVVTLSGFVTLIPVLLLLAFILRRLPVPGGMAVPSPLALGVAAVTPCAVLNPLAGMSLSIALNIVMLLTCSSCV